MDNSETIKILKKQLKELEQREFMLQMVDHWSSEDYKYHDKLYTAIKDTKNTIKELEGK